ncbi:unnamed protein product [Blepharisma stoltei]|uniref:Uncharacterized protein n=1 Tax=Blepharisma stoltei TaxID=1481888 RepID=A0AAU9JA21_9CILI|nr:unnamed protein product [Blepharisma stoltei]
MDLYKKLEQYIFEGEMYQAAMYDLQNKASLSMIEKQKLKKAYSQGWWLGNLIQCSILIGSMMLMDKKLAKFTREKKAAFYIVGIGMYYFAFILTKSFGWHHSFSQVEPIVRQYVEEATPEEIAKLQGEIPKSIKTLISKKNDSKESQKE